MEQQHSSTYHVRDGTNGLYWFPRAAQLKAGELRHLLDIERFLMFRERVREEAVKYAGATQLSDRATAQATGAARGTITHYNTLYKQYVEEITQSFMRGTPTGKNSVKDQELQEMKTKLGALSSRDAEYAELKIAVKEFDQKMARKTIEIENVRKESLERAEENRKLKNKIGAMEVEIERLREEIRGLKNRNNPGE